MNNDLVFRVAAAVLFLALTVSRQVTMRKFMDHRAAWAAMRKMPLDTTLLIAYVLFIKASLVLYLFFPASLAWATLRLATRWRWSGIALSLAGMILLVWADRSLGRNFSVALQIKEGHRLVTHGSFRWVRHPIYAALLLFSIGMTLLSANAAIGAGWVGGGIFVFTQRISREEAMLIKQFGESYRDYRRRTGAVIPKFRHERA